MKKRITKIVGVVLSLALLSSLAMVAPVSASAPIADPDVLNDWEEIAQPKVMPNTDVDLLAVAADGTLFASIYDADADPGEWYSIYRSEDQGWSWTLTKFKDYPFPITAIECAPNWDANNTVYIGTADGQVFRCTDAGKAEPVLLRQIVDSIPIAASVVFDMDLWTDGSSIWILVATNRDVMVMEDTLFAEWIDMDLTISFDGGHASQDGTPQGIFGSALVSRFAPDFDQSGLIWSIVREIDGDAWVTATISPGQWGQIVNSVELDAPGIVHNRVDIDFAEFYSSTSAPIVYAALGFWGTEFGDDIFLIEGGFLGNNTIATPLNVGPFGTDFMSVQVSGEVIMGGEYWAADVWISRNGGDIFSPAVKPPTGQFGTQVLMAPGTFDPATGLAYAATRGLESAFSYTTDGGATWNQIGFWDTEIDFKMDLAFDPNGPGAMLLTENNSAGVLGFPYADSLWRTADITAEKPKWERVYTSNLLNDFQLVTYIMDGSGILLSTVSGSDNIIVKSTDNGQLWFPWRTLPGTMGWIHDWVVYDGATMYAVCDNGFFGTSRFGPAKQRLVGTPYATIALQPGFDPNDPENSTVLVGGYSGDAVISFDAGNVWQAPDSVGSGEVCVAFNNDGTPYFAVFYTGIVTATISATGLKDVKVVKDSLGDVATADMYGGIWIGPDDALYGIVHDEDTTTIYSYDADGTVSISGEPQILYNITVREIGGVVEVNFVSGDPSGIYLDYVVGTFINDEALAVIGANLEVVTGPAVFGWIQVQGLVSGATGMATVPADALPGGFTPGEYLEVIDSLSQADIVQSSIVLTDEALSGTFVDGETLIVTSCTLAGNATGGVTGSITVEGALSGNVSTIAVDIATDLGFFDGEEIDCTGSTIVADEDTAPGITTYNEHLVRLLKHEPKPCAMGNVWEYVDIAGAWPVLWGNSGSNNLWTILDAGDELWVLEDTLSGPVTGVTVSSIGETKATVSWNAVNGGEDASGDDNVIVYDVALLMETYIGLVCVAITPDQTGKTAITIMGLDDNEDYVVQVRVAPQPDSVYSSRWSAEASFTTIQTICQPKNLVPVNGMQDAPLLPSFVWEDTCGNAVSYEFQLSTDPGMGTLLVDITTENTAYTIAAGDELEYDTNHYWRVRAVSDTGTKSTWCFSNFHTRTEAIPPVTVEPPPTPTIILPAPQVTVVPPDVDITLPAPQVTVIPPAITVDVPPVVTVTQQPVPTLTLPERDDPGTPAYIWVIVGIGALLTIAVIVLIIRTRRVV